jgi:hypothetical protein
MASAHGHAGNGADAQPGEPGQRARIGPPRPEAPAEGTARPQAPDRPAPPLPTAPQGKLPNMGDSLRGLDAAAEALGRAQLGDRKAALHFLAYCMAVRLLADRSGEKRRILEEALAKRRLRARSSDRSEFTRIVKYVEQRCSLSSALRSIYVAVLEHAYAHGIEAEAVPDFVDREGGLNKCAAAYRASRRDGGGAPRDDVMARAREEAKDVPSEPVHAVPPDEKADFVVLLLKRDRKRAGHWKALSYKPADEKTIRGLLPMPPER